MMLPVACHSPVASFHHLAIEAIRFGVFCMVTRPAGCGICGPLPPDRHFGFGGKNASEVGTQPGCGEAPIMALMVLNSTPADDVVSLETTVLFAITALSVSWSEIPPPSQPATLFTMMLLVKVMSNQLSGVCGKLATSEPLTWRRRIPPPEP